MKQLADGLSAVSCYDTDFGDSIQSYRAMIQIFERVYLQLYFAMIQIIVTVCLLAVSCYDIDFGDSLFTFCILL